MIYFHASGGQPFTLSIFNSTCYVKDKHGNVATFERLSFVENGTVLHIDHFALTNDERNRGRGEEVLRAFARLVAEHEPLISAIKFSLYGRSVGEVQRLANGREDLLRSLEAIDVWQERPNSRDVIIVHGTWLRGNW